MNTNNINDKTVITPPATENVSTEKNSVEFSEQLSAHWGKIETIPITERAKCRSTENMRKKSDDTLLLRVAKSLTSLEEHHYQHYTRGQLMRLFSKPDHHFVLTEDALNNLLGTNEKLTFSELHEFYIPLIEQLSAKATEHLTTYPEQTFMIGIAGSVAVGKSTTARVIHALLAKQFERVSLVSTDNFIYPNKHLEAHEIMHRKGFPESFNQEAMLTFFEQLKNNQDSIEIPIYDHISYDILQDKTQIISHPQVMVLEGLNVLQPYNVIEDDIETTHHFSEHLHFSIYVDAPSHDIKEWYIQRFLAFRNSSFPHTSSRWQHYATLTEEAATAKAGEIWDAINGLNLQEHIEPSKIHADLIIEKAADHSVLGVKLK